MTLLRWLKAMAELPGRVDRLEQGVVRLRKWRIVHLTNHANRAKGKPKPCLLTRWVRRNRRDI